MKTIGKNVLLVALFSLFALLGVLPLHVGPSSTAYAAPVEIEFANWHWMEPGRGDVWRKLCREFEKEYPNIKVKEGGVPYPRFEETFLTRLAGGVAPDVLMAGDYMFFSFFDRDYLTAFEDFFVLPMGDVMQAQDMANIKGKTYGMLVEYVTYALLYNERLFKEAGITEVPKSTDAFLNVARKLNSPPQQYAFGTRHTMPEQGGWWYEMSYWVAGFGATWAQDGKPTVNTPEMIAAVEFYKKMYDENLFPKGVDAATYRRMFWEEKIAMLSDNQAVYLITKNKNPKIQLKAAPNPFQPKPVVTHMEAVFLTLPKDAKHPKEAAMFLQWVFKHLKEYGMGVESIVGSKSASKEIVAKFPHLEVFANTPVALNGGILPQGFETRQPEFRQIVLERVSQVLVENRNAAEAMNEAQMELEKMTK
jgi:multiple sugar transport system substrate-binding protein